MIRFVFFGVFVGIGFCVLWSRFGFTILVSCCRDFERWWVRFVVGFE